ncbi:BTB/POZ domain-containing protein FBL11 isoform X6 [Durio zibethinus]|uniref:BTB/POZ domain-containing protein FBL11 isoform X6 n=1 Tax=Durio zibethinus TaxID=66656 RepID=A0A6P6AQM8_DURZI|nr:BTB/POZ domain-containing protein FBL11 isoform X6 [Durio zibethinus]
MASSSDDDEFVILVCTDPNNQIGADISNEEIVISTTDISHWDFPSILSFQTFKIQAHRNRLIEESSYFRGLLSGSFSESCSDCISIEWQLETFLNVLRCMFRCPLDITSRNFIPLFEAALYFGVEMLLLQLKSWFSEVSLSKDPGLLKIQLDDLIRIWNFGLEHANGFVQELCASYLARNFMWTMSSNFFEDVPYDLLLLCIKHPHLTVDSEKHLSDALFIWLDSNTKQLEGSSKTENEFSDILKQIRISLLPLWFASGKRSSGCFSELANESVNSIFRLMKVTTTGSINALGDSDLSHLRIRLTEYSKRMDLSGCPQITPMILLLSLLPNTHSFALALRKSIKEAVSNLEQADGSKYQISQGLLPTLSFEAVQEVDISGCLKLHLEVAIECFSKSFPCLRKVKAAYLLNFRTTTLYKLVQKCPLVSEVDITIDMNPLISSQVSVISSTSSSPVIPLAPNRPYIVDHSFSMTYPYHLGPSLANITKLTMEGRSDVCAADEASLLELLSQTQMLKSLCLRDTNLVDNALCNFSGSLLEMLDVSNTMISGAALNLVVRANPGLKCLNARGCKNLFWTENKTKGAKFSSSYSCGELLTDLGKTCRLEEIALGWGFSYFSLQDLKPAILSLRAMTVGLGGTLPEDALILLPTICPLLESLVLYFQVISDCTIINMITSLRQLRTLSLCYCLGDISISSFNLSMPSLRKLRLERVTPWMTNNDLVLLTQNCTKLVELALLGCKLLNSDAQCIISRGWPGLISIHLEDCGELTKKGISSLFNCTALEDLLLRHNGPGVQRNFILDAALKLPMLRQVSLDLCDASEGDFDLPDDEDESDRYSLRSVKIARCKSGRCNAGSHFAEVLAKPAHRETLVLVWNSRNLVRTVVKERL